MIALHRQPDEALAVRAARGDGEAVGELAKRYRPLLRAATRWLPEGLDAEDARQLALIGLFEACCVTDGARCFAGLARLRVRWRVSAARRAATANNQRILTQAAPVGEITDERLVSIAAPAAVDPARVVEARDELRTGLQVRAAQAERRANAPKGDLRRRYSAEQIARAMTMIAQGHTVTETAAAVGAACSTVSDWVKSTPADSPARRALAERRAQAPDGNLCRRFSDEQIARAVAMVANGATISAAAAAVGTSWLNVQRWVRKAA